MRGRAFQSSSTRTNAKLKMRTKPPMFSFGKSPMRKRTKRRTTARGMKMMIMMMTTNPTAAIRSECALIV